MYFLFQKKSVGAQINIFLAGDQACNDLANLRVHERLAAGDGNHGRAAFFDGAKTFFRSEIRFEDVGGILNLAASRAGQIAAEERLEHEHERVLLATGELLAQDVARNGPHLGYGNWHCGSETPDAYFIRV